MPEITVQLPSNEAANAFALWFEQGKGVEGFIVYCESLGYDPGVSFAEVEPNSSEYSSDHLIILEDE